MSAESTRRKSPSKAEQSTAVAWVLENVSEIALGPTERYTLTEAPSRERFFELLPDLDYEIRGGTQEEPLWAWMEHPWFGALGLSVDECETFLQEKA